MDKQMNRPSKGIAFLGFLLTFLMVLCLITGGLLMAFETTLLSGDDVSEVLESTNIYGTISDMVVSEISSSTENAGFSKEAIDKVFSEDVLKSATKTLTDAIKNNEDVDLSDVKDQCMEVVKDISENAVDDILDDIKESSDVVSIDVLKNNEIIKQLEKDYNVDITNVISDYVEDTYGSTTVNVSDIDIEKVRTEAKKSLNDTVIPTIEETVDEYIVEVNAAVNKQIKETNEEYDISGAIKLVESVLGIINVIMIVTISVSVVFALLQIAVIYRKRMNRGFRNTSIATLISGIVVLILGLVFNVIETLFVSAVGTPSDNIEKNIVEFITDNIAAVGGRTVLIGCIYIVMAIVFMIFAIVIKKKLTDGDNNQIDSGSYMLTMTLSTDPSLRSG